MDKSKSFIQKQKKSLLEEKEKIDKKIKNLKKYPDYGQDEEDKMQEMEDFENNLSIESQFEYLSKKIDKALRAIEDGTYGQCSACKKNIEQGRLKIMPYADLCVSCQAKNKKRKK
jgi:RNA polymerase-binding protein DksA